jgi:hypothetical protein
MTDLIQRLRDLEEMLVQGESTRRVPIDLLVCQAADALEAKDKRIAALEKVIQRQQFIEDRYEELMLSCRRVYRYYVADTGLFNASVKVMDFLIRRHATEIDEMNEEQE